MGMKFGTEVGVPSAMPNFTSIGATVKGIGPAKLKFLLRFDQNVEYKPPQGHTPGTIFTKFAVCTPFQVALPVTISLDLLKGLWSYGGFKLTGSGYPKFSAPSSGETMHQTSKSVAGARTCWRSCITGQVWWGSNFTRRRPKTPSFLSVCHTFDPNVTSIIWD